MNLKGWINKNQKTFIILIIISLFAVLIGLLIVFSKPKPKNINLNNSLINSDQGQSLLQEDTSSSQQEINSSEQSSSLDNNPNVSQSSNSSQSNSTSTPPPISSSQKQNNYALPSSSHSSSSVKPNAPAPNSNFAEEVVRLVNIERENNGLSPLSTLTLLTEASQIRANEVTQLFSHDRPNGTSCFTVLSELKVSYRACGENIAQGQKTPQEVVTGWMNSPGHRANILNPNFNYIGVGLAKDNRGSYSWTQLFIKQ